ncbi:DUF2802 domain-containing protein [Dongshaea marina]|uniref:DUF2802 domain-containing protein n=1 Tax=Dongshaea marina TaxID=2047966 RepID=UPI001F3F3221|nr:DUF2802 domain-containing protein [Dongshaea marina]
MISASYNLMTDQLFIYLLPALALVVALVALFLGLIHSRNQQHKLQAMERVLKEHSRNRDLLRKQVNEIQSGTLGLGKRLVALQSSLEGLQEQQQELSMREPENRLYSRAMRMVELGADLDELMRECELPRAEAELLLSLHQQQRQRTE